MVISKLWKSVESTNGAIQIDVENLKQVLERKVSIGAFLRVWKHVMHCNNLKLVWYFFYNLSYRGCALRQLGASMCNVQRRQCDLFGACNFIIKYGGATRILTQWYFIIHERTGSYIP
jgi:hypothetical protein